MKRALVIRLSAMGDVALSFPALAGWKAAHPDCDLHVLTRTRYAPLVERVPGVGRVWAVADDERRPPAGLRGVAFDRIFDLQGALKGQVMRWGLCGPVTVMGRRSLSRRWAAFTHDPTGGEHPPRFLDYARCLGVEPVDPCLIPPPLAPSQPSARVILCPGASRASKRWPVKRWRRLVEWLVGRQIPPILLAGPGEGSLLEACDPLGRVGRFVGDLTMAAALLQRADAVVCGDTGWLHLAEAVGTPCVAIFGPTVPGLGFGPRLGGSQVADVKLPCRPCSAHGSARCPKGHHGCLSSLATGDVVKKLEKQLKFFIHGH